jgi:hypothetical protein
MDGEMYLENPSPRDMAVILSVLGIVQDSSRTLMAAVALISNETPEVKKAVAEESARIYAEGPKALYEFLKVRSRPLTDADRAAAAMRGAQVCSIADLLGKIKGGKNVVPDTAAHTLN